MPEGPIVLCFDGSEHAKHAIGEAFELLEHRVAIVLVVWQTADSMSFPLAGAAGMGAVGIDLAELDAAIDAAALRTAEAGVAVADAAGFAAEPVSVKASGPVWHAIVTVAEERDARAIILGSHGLTGLRSIMVGSTSDGVLHHAKRPTLVVPRR